MEIVIRLGGFHLLISVLGGIRTVMESCGLRESMETIYASNSVNHMIDGKAYARAVRCHFLNEVSPQQLIINNQWFSPTKKLTNIVWMISKIYIICLTVETNLMTLPPNFPKKMKPYKLSMIR